MKPRVFIASSVEGLGIAYAIQENIEYDAEPTVWSQGVFEPSSYAIDDLVEELTSSDFGIFVFTPDDIQKIRDEEKSTVRDNVIFELGLFIGHLGRKRCFIVQPRGVENLRWPTDLAGLNPTTFEAKRRDNNIKAALGPACNQIRESMKKQGPKAQTVEEVVAELDEKSISVMVAFGKVPYFSRPPANTFDGSVFDQGVNRLRSLKCVRFDISADGVFYAYHWTDLGKMIIDKFNFTSLPGPHVETTSSTAPLATRSSLSLSDKARELLTYAAQDKDGMVMMLRDSGGLHIQTNGRQFAEPTPRSEAEWKAAVEELLGHRFLEAAGKRGEMFRITAKGFEAAESLAGQD